MNTRIEMNDTFLDIAVKLAEGNPGAATVIMQLFEKAAKIDPQDFMGSFGSILFLDTLHIYGSRIWMLYKDVCKHNVVSMVAMLRAVQLGIINTSTLNHAIDNYGAGLDVDATLAKVKKRLDQFDVQTETQS